MEKTSTPAVSKLCPFCYRWIKLNKAGKFANHCHDEVGGGPWCVGARKTPDEASDLRASDAHTSSL